MRFLKHFVEELRSSGMFDATTEAVKEFDA